MDSIRANSLYWGKIGSIWANWFYLEKWCSCSRAKVVVFVQKLLYSGKSGCIRAKNVAFGQSGGIWAKVVIFGQK